MSTATSTHPRDRRRRKAALAATLGLAAALALVAPASANATDIGGVLGNITCTAFPNTAIGTTATARGRVTFELKYYNSKAAIQLVEMGSSPSYATWGWKWWSSRAGNFIVVAYNSNGDVKGAARYCQNMFS